MFLFLQDLHVFKTPTPPLTPPPTEHITPIAFTCQQIEALNKQVSDDFIEYKLNSIPLKLAVFFATMWKPCQRNYTNSLQSGFHMVAKNEIHFN